MHASLGAAKLIFLSSNQLTRQGRDGRSGTLQSMATILQRAGFRAS